MNIVAIIAARYTSTRLKEKNLKMFCGRPLVEWLIRQVVYAKQITHSILVTDSYRMAKIAERYDVEVMIQPLDYPGFGTANGGATAFNFAHDKLGDRIKDIDAFIVGVWNLLCKVDDWDGMIDMFIERKPSVVNFALPIPCVGYAIDLGEGHYFTPPIIKSHRLMGWADGAIRSTTWENEFQLLSGTEREKHELFYRLERWQQHGGIDYQSDFDVAEFLFRKHILKDSETPYEDYYKGKVDLWGSDNFRDPPANGTDYDVAYPDQVRGVGPPPYEFDAEVLP
ncbi:hypothetical protein LCGC14_1956580 [marine sediment metagenome]|uniref:MobA-like NTP transferase domain-containing protein n=1 Tax=marine sediment metagenome TaxID=412755 RepID=A0A0F9ID18_9ZZZZ